ncbi:MAG: 50S ribosomal protein L24, partial [Parvibaculum sp.]
MAAKVRKGDKVVVLTGKDKGKKGSVIAVFPKEERALVQGVNMVKRHEKPSQTTTGGIVTR